jgi:ABC-type Fe3+-siderophore transport system permease subunit
LCKMSDSSMTKHKTKKQVKGSFLQHLRRHRLVYLLMLIAVIVATGLYMQANRSNAAGGPFTSNVIMHIPGNNSNPALGHCSWSCFKPEVTQVSVRIVPIACVSQPNQVSRDWCTDITSATLTSCHTYNVQSGDQDIPAGTISFAPYGPNAGQNVGQIYYTLYAAAGTACGNTHVAGVGGTPQSPTVYMGVLPNCGTALGEACPIVTDTPITPREAEQPTIPGLPNGPAGNGPAGEGPTGIGRAGGGSRSASATTQSTQDGSIPTSSAQGDQQQALAEPSPFFDGKQYVPGSTITEPSTFAKVSSSLSTRWPYVVAGLIAMLGLAGAGLYWWRKQHKRGRHAKAKKH